MEYIKIDKSYKYLNKVKYLFEHAFPEDERPPFNFLIKLDKNQLFGIEDKGEFIGLVSYVEYQDLLYIFFLAIKKNIAAKDMVHKCFRICCISILINGCFTRRRSRSS